MQAVEHPGRRGWCGVSCGNVVEGKRERRQAESIYLDEQWAPGVQQLLLQDVVVDELHAAIHDESLSDEEVYSDSDDARGSESGSVTSESQSDGSDGESDCDFEPASSDTDGESEPSSTESSWEEPEFVTSDESSGDETDATDGYDPMDLEGAEAEGEGGSPALFEWFEGLEVSTDDWDEFNANLSDLRWRMRPRDLPYSQFYIAWANSSATGVACA
mmetsp:Transcript_103683/g.297851  ORF Transcript_103683/g.297851 Transcript_103683/m.297851 type:complete len:217 (-) Transcript_103683:96-746(-)